MPTIPLKIAGMGRYLPRRVVESSTLEAKLGLPAGWAESHAGVRTRHVADIEGGETASWMGAEAAREALAAAQVGVGEIDLIVNASGTPEQAIPDGGALIQRALGLGSSGIPAMSVHATCLSFLAALDVVSSWIALGRYRRVLVVSSDITSVGLDPESPEVAVLFGDAAAAAVVVHPGGGESGVEAASFATFGDEAPLTQIPGCGTSRHPSKATTTLRDACFQMAGPPLLKATLRHAPPFLRGVLGPEGWEGVDHVIVHQASLAGLKLLERLGAPPSRVHRTLAELGNCVAASIPLTLYAAQDQIEAGQRVLLVGTGAGLSLGALRLRW